MKGFMAKPPLWDPNGQQWGCVSHWPLFLMVGSVRGRSTSKREERSEKWRLKSATSSRTGMEKGIAKGAGRGVPAFAATPASGSGYTRGAGKGAAPASGSGYKRNREGHCGPALAASTASSSTAFLTSTRGDIAISKQAAGFSLTSIERGGHQEREGSDWASDGGHRSSGW